MLPADVREELADDLPLRAGMRSRMRRKKLRASALSKFFRTTAVRTRRLASRASRSMRHGRA